jgi:hypothetical protein
MTRSRVAGWIRAWVDLYTRGLPADLRAARRDEIDDDLWCQLEEAAADGPSGRRVDGELVARLLLGMPADVGWRLAQRGRPATARVETTPSMTDQSLGAWAIAAGLTYLALAALYVPVGDALWTGGMAPVVMIGLLVGAIAFAVTGIGLAWHHQEHIGLTGAVGAGLVVLGAVVTTNGPALVLAFGSAMLMWQLGRIGVVSRRNAAVHIAAALVVLIAEGPLRPAIGQPASRILDAVTLAPYLLSWVAIGLSLVRRSRPHEAAGTA